MDNDVVRQLLDEGAVPLLALAKCLFGNLPLGNVLVCAMGPGCPSIRIPGDPDPDNDIPYLAVPPDDPVFAEREIARLGACKGFCYLIGNDRNIVRVPCPLLPRGDTGSFSVPLQQSSGR